MRDAEFRDRIAAEVERELGAAQAKRALVRYESIWYSGDARTSTVQKIADELVREFRRSPGSERTRNRNGEQKSCGFAVTTYDQSLIEENARDKVREEGNKGVAKFVTKRGEITEAGWKQLNEDVQTIERNSMRWLNDTFAGARSEGHDKHDDLIGTLWYDPKSERQMELLELAGPGAERIDMQDWGFGGFKTAFDGVSDFGAAVLGGAITFFDCDEEF